MQTKQELIDSLAIAQRGVREIAAERQATIEVLDRMQETLLSQMRTMQTLIDTLTTLAAEIARRWPDGQDPADFWKE